MPGIAEFLNEFECRFWFTYRKDFLRLAPSILSSDAGFGCMLRAGQSMVAEALSQLWLKEKRHPNDIFADPGLLSQYKLVLVYLTLHDTYLLAHLILFRYFRYL